MGADYGADSALRHNSGGSPGRCNPIPSYRRRRRRRGTGCWPRGFSRPRRRRGRAGRRSACRRHLRNGVEQRAGEDASAARRRLEAAGTVFREAHFAAFEFAVEIDRDGEAAVGGALRRIVAVGAEMGLVLGGIARDDIALHAGDHELVYLLDFRHDPAADALAGLVHQRFVFDDIVLAALVAVVGEQHGFAIDFAHEAKLGAAVLFVEPDQMLAEFGLEDVGEQEYRRLEFDPGVFRRRRQGFEIGEKRIGIRRVLAEFDELQHAQCRVEDDPETAGGHVLLAGLRIARIGAIKPAKVAGLVEEEADARKLVGDALVGFVAGIDGDAEEAEVLVVEHRAVGRDGFQRLLPDGIGGGQEETEDEVCGRRRYRRRSSDWSRCGHGTTAPGRRIANSHSCAARVGSLRTPCGRSEIDMGPSGASSARHDPVRAHRRQSVARRSRAPLHRLRRRRCGRAALDQPQRDRRGDGNLGTRRDLRLGTGGGKSEMGPGGFALRGGAGRGAGLGAGVAKGVGARRRGAVLPLRIARPGGTAGGRNFARNRCGDCLRHRSPWHHGGVPHGVRFDTETQKTAASA